MSNLRTEHEIEIDQIHGRQLAEKDAIIETMNEAHKILMAEKDAEIEGLKARVEALRQIREEDKALITELCDALEEQDPGYDRIKNLLQRAREATR